MTFESGPGYMLPIERIEGAMLEIRKVKLMRQIAQEMSNVSPELLRSASSAQSRWLPADRMVIVTE